MQIGRPQWGHNNASIMAARFSGLSHSSATNQGPGWLPRLGVAATVVRIYNQHVRLQRWSSDNFSFLQRTHGIRKAPSSMNEAPKFHMPSFEHRIGSLCGLRLAVKRIDSHVIRSRMNEG